MEYKCSVCEEVIKDGAAEFFDHTEKHIVDIVKEKHPKWIEEDGICPKCVEYYKSQLKGNSQES